MEEDKFKRNTMEEYLELLAELVDGIDEECKAILEQSDEVSDEEMIEYIRSLKETTEQFKKDFNKGE